MGNRRNQSDSARPQQQQGGQGSTQRQRQQPAQQGGTQGASRQQAHERSAEDLKQQSQQGVYGEGNYQATRDYNKRTRDFIASGKVDEAAREAAPDSEAEALQMAAAEAEGKRHAKGEDPALSRKSNRGEVGPEDTSTPKPGEEE